MDQQHEADRHRLLNLSGEPSGSNGIAEGYGQGRFGVNDNITRQQLAAILMRYAAFKKYDVTKTADLGSFRDAGEVAAWARQAVEWSLAEKLIEGRTGEALAPKGTATRAAVAAILMRFGDAFLK